MSNALLRLLDADDNTHYNQKGDKDVGTARVELWVWNTDTLEWERMTQPVAADLVIDGKVSANFEMLESVMNKILKQMVKMNMHLAILNETEIKNEEVEV